MWRTKPKHTSTTTVAAGGMHRPRSNSPGPGLGLVVSVYYRPSGSANFLAGRRVGWHELLPGLGVVLLEKEGSSGGTKGEKEGGGTPISPVPYQALVAALPILSRRRTPPGCEGTLKYLKICQGVLWVPSHRAHPVSGIPGSRPLSTPHLSLTTCTEHSVPARQCHTLRSTLHLLRITALSLASSGEHRCSLDKDL